MSARASAHDAASSATMRTNQGRQGPCGYTPYAALPSLHVAWALIVGVTLLRVGRRRLLRVAGLLSPLVMLVTILVAGNYLLLDAAGSLIVVTSATGTAARWSRGTAGIKQQVAALALQDVVVVSCAGLCVSGAARG